MTGRKAQARSFAKEYILSIPPIERDQFHLAILLNLKNSLADWLGRRKSGFQIDSSFARFSTSPKIALYSNDLWEPPVDELVEDFPGVEFCYPKVVGMDLEFMVPETFEVGSFGIREPMGSKTIAVRELDLVVLPGLGFAEGGHRLGRGKGYYDRSFSDLSVEKIWGVCYHTCAFLDFAPESHDIRVSRLFTEKGEFSFLD